MELARKLQRERPLRVMLPTFYNYLIMELEKECIHAYDIQANAVESKTGYVIHIFYGQGFTQTSSNFFSHSSIENVDESVKEYIKTIAEKCKQVMIADYFKMMKM